MSKKITIEDCIRDIGEIPYCQCGSNEGRGCGLKIKINPQYHYRYKHQGYPKYINGHEHIEKHPSQETKDKISKANSGENHWNYGNKFAEETKNKMSESRKGKIQTKETLNKKSKSLKEYYKLHPGEIKGINNPNYDPSVHKTIEEIISEFGEIPLCQCDECQKTKRKVLIKSESYTKYKREGYPKYIFGHYPKGKKHQNYGKQTPHGLKIFPHSTPLQGTLLFHRWDRKYAEYLDSMNILYKYESRTFDLIINERETSYTPDFYLLETNEYTEVKGYWRGDAKEKYEAFKIQYPNIRIKLLMGKDLQNLGINLKLTKEEKEILSNYKLNIKNNI